MTMLSLGQAAKLAGVGKTTVARAITAGRLSAGRKEDGGYLIDPAELSRVYDVRPERLETAGKPETAETAENDGGAERDATPQDAAETVRRQLEVLVLQERVKSLEDLMRAERERREAAEADRDRWADQAARVAALLPPPAANIETKALSLLDRLLGRRVA